MSTPDNPFARACIEAVAQALNMPGENFAVTAPPKPELGDFAVGCFPAAKTWKKAPPLLAKEVADGFAASDLLDSAHATGPFVNFRANRAAMFAHLFSAAESGRLIRSQPGQGKSVCIDFSSPNISKHLAYHHIRSTVIGHALVLMHRALGYRVIGINHLGDWGTTHGMLLAAYDRWPPEGDVSIEWLNQSYVRFRKESETDAELAESGKNWFLRLEEGDPVARERWQLFKSVSWAEFQVVYDLLGIEFDEVKGESDYVDAMPAILEELAERGLSKESQGALVVPMDDEDMPPLLLRKQDGATLYATRDLAAAKYRWQTYEFERSLYVVDRGQSLHFKQLFEVLGKMELPAERMQHIAFGLIRVGGKKTGTRTGKVVLLKDLLADAEERSKERIAVENADMPSEQLQQTARDVGIGAVVFANLSSQRDKDIDFEWETALSVKGDSGPYVQYSHARCASIERKALERGLTAQDGDAAQLTQDAEWALALKLAEFSDTVARATEACEPHTISRYLLDVSSAFARFYTGGNQDPALRVLCDDDSTARARLRLVAATKTVLASGLAMLGIAAPDSM